MSDPQAAPSRAAVRCRPIEEADLDAVVALLTKDAHHVRIGGPNDFAGLVDAAGASLFHLDTGGMRP